MSTSHACPKLGGYSQAKAVATTTSPFHSTWLLRTISDFSAGFRRCNLCNVAVLYIIPVSFYHGAPYAWNSTSVSITLMDSINCNTECIIQSQLGNLLSTENRAWTASSANKIWPPTPTTHFYHAQTFLGSSSTRKTRGCKRLTSAMAAPPMWGPCIMYQNAVNISRDHQTHKKSGGRAPTRQIAYPLQHPMNEKPEHCVNIANVKKVFLANKSQKRLLENRDRAINNFMHT